MKKFEGGRRPTKGRSGTKWNFGTVQLSVRDRDEEMSRQKRGKSVIKYSEVEHEPCQFSEKE